MSPVPKTRVEALLWDLCVMYGYCLPPENQERLIASPPKDIASFVDAVVVAEGRDPLALEEHERLDLSELVRDWLFDDGQGRGTRSGLP